MELGSFRVFAGSAEGFVDLGSVSSLVITLKNGRKLYSDHATKFDMELTENDRLLLKGMKIR